MSSWEGCLSNDERQWDTMKTSTIYACARWRVSFPPPTREVFFFFFSFNAVISSASPPANTSHGSSPLSLPPECSTLLFPLSLVLFPPLPPGIFQFQTITPPHPRLSFSSPLCSLLGSGYLEALWPTGIKAFQLHLQSQNKNKTAGFCSPQW